MMENGTLKLNARNEKHVYDWSGFNVETLVYLSNFDFEMLVWEFTLFNGVGKKDVDTMR